MHAIIDVPRGLTPVSETRHAELLVPASRDATVLREFDASISHACTAIATLLAYLAEVDDASSTGRRPYPSMLLYCVREKHIARHTALKRIASRARRGSSRPSSRRCRGQLNQTACCCSAAPDRETADELLAAATHKSKAEIELLLGRRASRSRRADGPAAARARRVTGELAHPQWTGSRCK